MPQQDPAEVARVVPMRIRAQFDSVLTAVRLDLRCDGDSDDLAAQVLRSGRLAFVVYSREQSQWQQVLQAPGPADGPEVLILAADLNDDARLDLVTIGQDEGGYVPRVFVSTGRHYERVPVPEQYVLRQEERWTGECRRQILPVLLDGPTLQLRRETISPESDTGHGTDCALPADTVAVSDRRLVPVRGSGLSTRNR